MSDETYVVNPLRTIVENMDADLVYAVTKKNGGVADLSGATAFFRLCRTIYGEAVIEKSGADVVVDNDAKTITVTLEPEDTDGKAGTYEHAELKIVRSGAQTVGGVGPIRIRPTTFASAAD